ncbi:pectinesterase family protein [Pelosinus propionicus]|uniref:Pectinesterase n=1 Tax=Pelosinus propionicus DSM 13327 TaxID=1123291 RepID=A0A1I4JWB1_9FIRM|nr:pectinesterase family protein [Pelosinus propionicus]SFL70641.1 pectinesterase [Pelosinus propionicus DSM 13327]
MLKKFILSFIIVLMTINILHPISISFAANRPITVYLAGDSTVMTYSKEQAPKAGWGQMLSKFLSGDVTIKNFAKGGRSSKTFINEGRLNQILDQIQPGDYLLIQFGHNDEKSIKVDPERKIYTEPSTEYKGYIQQYIWGARQHHAVPVLVTPVERRRFDENGKINSTHTAWTAAMKEVALEEHVPVIDLERSSKELFESLGIEGTKPIFFNVAPGESENYPNGAGDNTHFMEYGAHLMAKLVIDEIKKLDIGLKSYIIETGWQNAAFGLSKNFVVKNKQYDSIVDSNYEGNDGKLVNGRKMYKTVQAAVDGVDKENNTQKTIFIKKGTYKEKLIIDRPHITLIGEDTAETKITYDLPAGALKEDGTKWGMLAASVNIYPLATDFIGINITFENTFDRLEYPGLKDGQALALRNDADRSLFVNCSFLSHQDTLLASFGKANRQFYYKCYIAGDVDFIYGMARAVFEDVDIMSLERDAKKYNGYITAAGTDQESKYGFLIENSRLISNIKKPGTVFLGRPWRQGAQVVYKNCYMGEHISTVGWIDMSNNTAAAARLYEYGSTGPGAVISNTRRVLSDAEAKEYTIEKVLEGWNPMASIDRI